MVLEGFIAMVWAAGAMGVYNLALQEPNAGLATGTVGVVCKYLLGHVGGIIALLGVIVLPITSGDTALRALRLSLSETLHIDQSTNGKRIKLAVPIFALVIAILVFAKTNADGFNSCGVTSHGPTRPCPCSPSCASPRGCSRTARASGLGSP